MERISRAVIRHRKGVVILTLVLCLAGVLLIPLVEVRYDLAAYLPADAPTRQAMDRLTAALPNLELYLPGVSVREIPMQKDRLRAIPGVEEVLWLDDLADLRGVPLEILDQDLLGSWYQEGPLLRLTLDARTQSETVPRIREAYPGGLLRGTAADAAQQVNGTMRQVASIMFYVVPLCLLILILATRHWADPFLFLVAIGVAILLNEGSNAFLGGVSFITRACSALLQLAVSIDYAVFLLHSFGELRDRGLAPAEAMAGAMRESSRVIASSAMTTVFGFLALLFMDFTLGRDMGIVLAKGVLLSYLSVMVVLPAVALLGVRWIDRTLHRSLIPSFHCAGRLVLRYGAPLALAAVLVLPLAYLAQRQNAFVYGTGGMHSPDSPLKQEQAMIEQRFGSSRTMLLLVPAGDRAREAALGQSLRELSEVSGVTSYADSVSVSVPPEVLPEASDTFYQDGYARFILEADTKDEGKEAFRLVEEIRLAADRLYPGRAFLLGESAVNHDLKTIITGDSLQVLLAGLLSIGLVLMVTFRSLSLPLLLLMVIQGSIWLNMGLPYIQGNPLNYIGYLIVSSVQLGATVDYGILLSQRYLEGRQIRPPREAAAWALAVCAPAILPPAMILTLAGYALGILVRENGVISEMGIIIGRGASISAGMVLLVLPRLLAWLDGIIRRTTMKPGKGTL